MRKVLVTGASGYVGGRLVGSLLNSGFEVRVLVRNASKISGYPWVNHVEIIEGDAFSFDDLKRALSDVHTAFYLLHSINASVDFDKAEERMARTFVEVARQQNVQQIVYLGGIQNDVRTSRHLSSRARTGEILASTEVPVLEIRAGIIIGSGSASFEMLRHLTHRLPLMTTPKWVSNKTHPIAIRDVLWYLDRAAKLETPVNGIYDVGGPDILSYAEMMQIFAKVAGLRKRVIIQVPLLTPRLSSLWIGLVTPVPTSLAKPLVESLISETVADEKKALKHLLGSPEEGLISVEHAIELALTNTSQNAVATRWSDASLVSTPWQVTQSDPEWAGETEYHDERIQNSLLSSEVVWSNIEGIGGTRGWYGADILWWARGLLDRLGGGVGLRRGRRDQNRLRVGDSLDFWRVEDIQSGKYLRLRAEMKLPGKAWLEFYLEDSGNKLQVRQKATFQPHGLGGHMYWFLVLPFHIFVFPTMLRNITTKSYQ
ncbi:MAG: SDR family oxidoreductase [Candidatus Nanopelagicales bacterium]